MTRLMLCIAAVCMLVAGTARTEESSTTVPADPRTHVAQVSADATFILQEADPTATPPGVLPNARYEAHVTVEAPGIKTTALAVIARCKGRQGIVPDYLQAREGWVPDYLQARQGWLPDWLPFG